jgi:DNA modification methylase
MKNTIFNESCLDTMSRMKDNSIDLVVTSPPYFNAREYSQYKTVKSYMETMRNIFTEVERTLKECRFCVVNISPVIVARENRNKESSRIPLPYYFVPMMEEIGFKFMEDIIWIKPEGAVFNRLGHSFSLNRRPYTYKPNIITEYILVFKTNASKNIEHYTKEGSTISEYFERTNVWKMNPETHSKHSAPFPEELPAKVISYYSYEEDVVYDPFLGSGTTAKMAKLTKRKYIGSEINEDYFKIAQKRLSQTQEYFF